MATCIYSNNSKERVVQQLSEVFGATVNSDVIKTVAVSFEYDITRSSAKLLEISRQPSEESWKKMYDVTDLTFALPRPVSVMPPARKSKKAMDFERAVDDINKGYKVMVILRGMPGSGKSYLARKVLQSTIGYDQNHPLHILSADDFFYQRRTGFYDYDVRKIEEAHTWNQKRATQALTRSFSPVLIDNTHTRMWEMRPYAAMATKYGYLIHILEPDTHWSFNDKELAKRNSHGVPRVKIKEMIDRYEKNITPEKLLSAFGFVYEQQRPPQIRLYPPPDILPVKSSYKKSETEMPKREPAVTADSSKEVETINLMEFDDDVPTKPSSQPKLENAGWTNNNPWTTVPEPSQASTMEVTVLSSDEESPPKGPISGVPDIEQMWGVNESSLFSWDIVRPLEVEAAPRTNTEPSRAKPVVETRDSSSNTSDEDFEMLQSGYMTPGLHGNVRVLIAMNRNINLYTLNNYMVKPAIPKIVMLDKSCMTDHYNKDFDSHILQLMNMFPHTPKTHLTYWYNKYKGDLEYTIEFLLDVKEEVTSLTAEDINASSREEVSNVHVGTDSDVTDASSSGSSENKPKKRKSRKNKRMSVEIDQVKKLIESKVDISGEHYSEKLLRVKNFKFGVDDIRVGSDPIPSTPPKNSSSEGSDEIIVIDSDLELDEVNAEGSKDEIIELNIGANFASQLENLFGDPNLPYPQGLQPVVQVPRSLARQLYTFYVESVYQQMETQKHVLEMLLKEDEEFARKLQREEDQHRDEAEAVPSLRQIMEDQQASRDAYRKESEKWRSLNPDNLAAMLTRQKLFGAFPTVAQDVLLEVLYAHNNNYKETVETLLASTGYDNVSGSIEQVKEPPIREEVVQEMKMAQQINGSEEYEDRQEASFYRAEASKYLKRRAELFEKAQQYHRRGMTEVAQFYSGLASLQTEYSVRANEMAATALLDEHSRRLQDFNTLDLHFLYVKEAIPALDVFLDRNINLLKLSEQRNHEYLQIITGRGNRSENGISKIKPVVKARLKERKIAFVELNPGLLKAKITKSSKVTSELTRT
ncbi:uncharacterized protein isoform X1 [Leptinotarsa decemlineata]|uniref:uncharacterized protein isoform X1 n=3 Tax=Leptinotarsa decemlineata TaxID=7539 RepID=UPI003D307B28